jgi:DNA topoisomerase VI subunit A
MNEAQKGFRPGQSIDDCKQIVLQKLFEAKNKKNDAYALFIDFKGAYDRVNRKLLYHLIEQHTVLDRPAL